MNFFWLFVMFFLIWGLIAAVNSVTFVTSLIMAIVATACFVGIGYLLK